MTRPNHTAVLYARVARAPEPAAPRHLVVTRTDFTRAIPLVRSDRGGRDRRFLTDQGVDVYVRNLILDARVFRVSGTVHVDGRPFVSFGPFGLRARANGGR